MSKSYEEIHYGEIVIQNLRKSQVHAAFILGLFTFILGLYRTSEIQVLHGNLILDNFFMTFHCVIEFNDLQ